MESRTAWILAPALLLAASIGEAADVDRYRLFNGGYEFTNVAGQTSWKKALFKIDTVTGEIFICWGTQIGTPSKFKQIMQCAPFEGTIDYPPSP